MTGPIHKEKVMQLVPMTAEEFTAYVAWLIPDYAADHVRAGNWSAEEAEALSAAQIREELPQGVQTPDHYLYTLHVEEESAPVGIIWLAVLRRTAHPRAFIYDILIYENYRRRGYASQALTAIEEKARSLGLDNIGLHVFGDNHGARALYDRQGYTVTDLVMAKKI
jgi:RimJ/RimL family protein N-acetyltransferase